MKTITVSTREELKDALFNGYDEILLNGDMYKQLEKLKTKSQKDKDKKIQLVNAISQKFGNCLMQLPVTSNCSHKAMCIAIVQTPQIYADVLLITSMVGMPINSIVAVVASWFLLGDNILKELLSKGNILEKEIVLEGPAGYKESKKILCWKRDEINN